VHTLTIDFALKTANLIEFKGSFTTINNEEETCGEDPGSHNTEAKPHHAIKECFH